MKKLFSYALCLVLLLMMGAPAWAEVPVLNKNAVSELYSAEGIYTDSVGNLESYSFHVPQINADTPAAEQINREIAERFGKPVEEQFSSMEEGCSLWFWDVSWHGYRYGSWLFLLVEAEMEGDFRDCAAYGYDFEKNCRVSNEMILGQFGVTEEEYLENLREKVRLSFEDMRSWMPEEGDYSYAALLEKTVGALGMEQPMLIDGAGQIETIVKILVPAGAGWYYSLVTPFAYG